MAEPNRGFLHQLDLYHRMGCPGVPNEHPVYQHWLYERELQKSHAEHRAPDMIRFGDENVRCDSVHVTGEATQETGAEDHTRLASPEDAQYRCRRCRTALATSPFLIPHRPPKPAASAPCAHIFLEPLSWMQAELSLGKLDGRLECPNARCKAAVGRYAWQGMRCSCESWVVPGISIARARIDEVKKKQG